MATSDLSAWDGWWTSQLRIVLLGGRNSGKSSVGNFLLGQEEFATKERTFCSRSLALVAGRWLMVVDAPGWWCDFGARDTSELVKREIISSVSLCPPGPHVFLITVKASSAFTERRRRAVEEHVALLGYRAWGHCIVVFTSDDGTARVEEEELLRRGGEALRWLAGRCGWRCHSMALGGGADVTDLLEKMQKLIADNGNRAFEMQEVIIRMAVEERRGVEERAQQRLERMKKRRSLVRERLRPITNIRIVLVGAKGSGKTSTLNTILCRECSCRPSRTAQCVTETGMVFGRRLTVVDTPGWWMNYFCDESPIFDRREMMIGPSLCPPGPHIFLLVVRLDRAFTETYRRAVQEHLELFGERVWSYVIVLFSFGDWLGGATPEQCIESEGEPLQWLVGRCSNRYHVLNNKTKGDEFQMRELIRKIEETLAGSDDRWHYQIEREAVEQMEVKMRGEMERAEERLREKEKQRQMARSLLETLNPLPELRIILVGGGKTGKSSCGNTILRRERFDAETPTTRCSEKRVQVGGRMVSVLDTPGHFSVASDLLAPSCALLLVVNASSSFADTQRRALEKQLEVAGGQAWGRAAILFSHGDWLGNTSIERRIESEGGPLLSLVEKCGNWYHVLDNKHWGGGAQADELIELVEEMLVGERLAVLRIGERMWKNVSLAGGRHPIAMVTRRRELKVLGGCRRVNLLSNDSCKLTGSASGMAQTSPSDNGGQIVTLRAGRRARTGFAILDGEAFMSRLAPMVSGKQRLRWTINLPVWVPTDEPLIIPLMMNSKGWVHRQRKLLGLPQTQHGELVEDSNISGNLRSGGLQTLIDQWGHSSLEELESFIDAYFETVWEEAMGSFQSMEPDCLTTGRPTVCEEAGREEVLASIDRKLSKLELLEEIRRDLAELRTSVERGWETIQELKQSKQD